MTMTVNFSNTDYKQTVGYCQPDSFDTGAILRAVYGNAEGIAALWTARRAPDGTLRDGSEQTHYFSYPHQLPQMLQRAARLDEFGHEVYFCAHLLTERRRSKANAAPVAALYADGDTAPIPRGELAPSIVVQTSPHRWHGYWLLTEPLEPVEAERLNKRLTADIGADPSGADLSQVLRFLSTHNHKYADLPTVTVSSMDLNRVFDAGDIAKLLPAEFAQSTVADRYETDVPPVNLKGRALEVWRGKRPISKEDGTVDRSETLWAIACELYKANASVPTIAEAVAERDTALGYHKYTDRADAQEQYRAIASKAAAQVRQEQAAQVNVVDALRGAANSASSESRSTNNTKPHLINAAELWSMDIPETRYVLPSLLPQGVTFLAAKPKIGKSWLAYLIALRVARGMDVLGQPTEEGDVLYLALEDNARRLKSRMSTLLGAETFRANSIYALPQLPARLSLATEWSRLDQGGLGAIPFK